MEKPALHIVGLPHIQITKDYSACAYGSKHLKFATMMHRLGYDVYSYSGEENEAEVTEHIPVVTKAQQKEWFGEPDYHTNFFNITWGGNEPHWVEMNKKAIKEIKKRAQPKDIICLIAGHCQKQIADALPNISVEYGIGYYGVFSDFKVFESYSHMHHVYGKQNTDAGGFYDCVIHNYFEKDDFYLGRGSGDYLLFVGRFIENKGVEIAVEVSKRTGMPLIMAGQGAKQINKNTVASLDGGLKFEGDITHVGHVNVQERAKLMADAKVAIVPTIYIEPFGGVSIEAMMAGTPVVATDYGAFTETVRMPAGKRFRTIGEATKAVEQASKLHRGRVRDYAIQNFSTEVAADKYDMYFEQLGTLWEKGFYSSWYPSKQRFENA